MGTNRESFKISHRLKYCNTFKSKIKALYFLKYLFTNSYRREFIILDNIITPYYQNIHCKLFGHKDFYYDSDDNSYMCKNCYKYYTEDDYIKYKRKQKIKNII